MAAPLLISLLPLFASCVNGQVPLTGFYRYGTVEGDSIVPPVDDIFVPLNISTSFPFYDKNQREVFISVNGVIYFEDGKSNFVPRPFPVRDFICVAPYWTDHDPSRGGSIFYRESFDQNLLSQITTEIRRHFVDHSSFTSRWAMVVTYVDVRAYGCVASPANCATQCSQTVTYQAVLTTNGIYSFTIFNYNKLDFTVGASDCNAHAQIGFNAGDGRRSEVVPSSLTSQIRHTAVDKSNVGIRGKWIYQVDGAEMVEACNSRGLLEIFPRKILYFGREDLFIGGPCFEAHESAINVVVGFIQMQCNITQDRLAHCLTPFFTTVGSATVSLFHNNTIYQSFVIVIDTNDNKVGNTFLSVDENNNPDTTIDITWNPNNLTGTGNILFKGFQVDNNLNASGDIINEVIVGLNYGQVPNTGRALLPTVPGGSPGGWFVRRIYLAGYRDGTETISLTRIVVKASNALCSEYSVHWSQKQPPQSEMNRIVDDVSRRSPCTPMRNLNTFPVAFNNYEMDPECTPTSSEQCEYYHPGAHICYRSINNNGYGAQCCYNSKFQLLLGPTSGGSLAFADPRISIEDHFWTDIIPYLFTCQCGNRLSCETYYAKRPSIPSTHFPPSGVGGGGGDPHLTTLDGTTYTFNPIGEFTYLTTGADQIQVRITQYRDHQGILRPACYISAFVVKSAHSDTIQVELTASQNLHFRVNGQSLNLETGVWHFSNITLMYHNAQSAAIYTKAGTGLTVQTAGRVLGAYVEVSEADKARVRGLLGNWDDDPSNDFQLPDGSWIPIDSSMRDIHYNFGMAWETTVSTSLFTYPSSLSWYDFRDFWFMPDFSIPPRHPSCGDDLECSYDIHVTGDIDLGLSNIELKETIEELEEMYEESMSYCTVEVNIANGVVHVDSNEAETQANYTFDCRENYNLYGDRQLTCVNGDHPPFPVCVDPEDTSMDEVTTEEPTTTTNLTTTITTPTITPTTTPTTTTPTTTPTTTIPTTTPTTTTPTTTPTTTATTSTMTTTTLTTTTATTSLAITTTGVPPGEVSHCGSILRERTDDGGLLIPSGWHHMCYLLSNDTLHSSSPCEALLVNMPGYNTSGDLLRAGGNFGCLATRDFDDPTMFMSCLDNYQHDVILTNCMTCPVMYVCVRYPV